RDSSRDGGLSRPWDREKQRLGKRLFDGAMCRYEGHEVVDGRLVLRVSRTSYRVFVNTNLFGPRDLPAACRCNPIGVSATLECADGVLLFGRRGSGVAYYPNRLHPFAGSLEWRDEIDVFAECRRELNEELSLTADELTDLVVAGVVEDVDLRHPEVVLHAVTSLTSDAVAARLDREEHDDVFRVPANADGVAAALADDRFTPVSHASMQLWQQRHEV
ncbi:MAG: hypothetical protein AAF561_09220, partial [Planctomycetota bacterium]